MLIATKTVEKLSAHIFDTREEMGKVAAADAAKRINAVIAEKGEANVVFAAAPSQNDRAPQNRRYAVPVCLPCGCRSSAHYRAHRILLEFGTPS